MFGEAARAIFRNIIVIAAGFMPLVIPPLIPYKVTGLLMATIMLLAGITTLVFLPAVVRLFEKPLFAVKPDRPDTWRVPVSSALMTAVVIVLTIDEFTEVSKTFLVIAGLVSTVVLTVIYQWLLRIMYGKL